MGSKVSAFDKPNVVLPLAASYNERGIAGLTTTVTNGKDQRKINAIYEPIVNAITGKTTLYLVKRPGVTNSGGSYGGTGQLAYLTCRPPGATVANSAIGASWVFSTLSGNTRASDSSTTTVIVAATNNPLYVDHFLISGTENVVVQLDTTTNQTVWYSTAIATFTQITDGDFTALTVLGKMEFLDGYAFILTSTNSIYNSDLNSISAWTATNFITKSIQQDVPVTLARLGNQVIAFGRETMEVFRNAGNATGSPLSVIQSMAKNIGFVKLSQGNKATSDRAVLGNTLYFIGSTNSLSNASNGLYAYNGSTVEKVSTPAIDKLIGDVYGVTTQSIFGTPAISLSLQKIDSTSPYWLMYFPKYNEWFEWNSTIFMPSNRPGVFLGVGANQHKLYSISITNNWTDDSTAYTWTHQFQLPSKGNQRQRMPYMGLKGDTATSAQSISVEFSDDDYASFQTARTIDMTSKEKMLTRCGSWKGSRVVRLSHSGNTEVRLSEFLARIE